MNCELELPPRGKRPRRVTAGKEEEEEVRSVTQSVSGFKCENEREKEEIEEEGRDPSILGNGR